MNISLSDPDGNFSVGRYIKTPEERKELLADIRKWREKHEPSRTGNSLLLALETVLVSAINDDDAAAEAAKAE